MLDPGQPESRTDIVRSIDLAEVWSQVRFLPGQRVPPHRHAFYYRLRGSMSRRCENDDVVLSAQVGFTRRRLCADVFVWHVQLVERHAPPALSLGVEPGVQECDARRCRGMRAYVWRCSHALSIEIQPGKGIL